MRYASVIKLRLEQWSYRTMVLLDTLASVVSILPLLTRYHRPMDAMRQVWSDRIE
jgi:hypothetical protein